MNQKTCTFGNCKYPYILSIFIKTDIATMKYYMCSDHIDKGISLIKKLEEQINQDIQSN